MALELDVWVPKFKQRLKRMEKGVMETPKEVARWGVTKAKTIAPIDTGSLIQAITWKSKEGSKKGEATIYVRDSSNTKHKGIHQRVARYSALHHAMPLKGFFQAKTRDPHWAFTIRREAKERFRKELRTKLDILKNKQVK